MKILDKNLISQFSSENYETIFNRLIESKTDRYTNEIKLPMGVDGLNFKAIKNNIKQISTAFCKRASSGKYLFSPFREIQVPKAPYTKNEFQQAKEADKLRTLSISTINDTIFQNMIYSSIYDYTERKFYRHIDLNVFGYRKGKSVKLAIDYIKQYIANGYIYGLDGDIEKFFDNINHDGLLKKLSYFYGENSLVTKYIKRFIKVKRVPVEKKVNFLEYHNKKPVTKDRIIGIPQGGVLSGLLANIYLYNFDKYIVTNLSKKYDIKYLRYADDFIILCKDPNIIIEIYKKCKSYLKREKLKLHDIDTSAIDDTPSNQYKTKAINLNKQHYIDFLGFRISPKYIGIKGDNIVKFKKNIRHIIEVSSKKHDSFDTIVYKINAKILGNGIFGSGLFTTCKICSKPQRPQSWVGFFIEITDMRILKNLDRWIRKQLHICYRRLNQGKRLPKNYFRYWHMHRGKFGNYKYNLHSLFKTAVYIKSWYRKHPNVEFCECKKFVPDLDISVS